MATLDVKDLECNQLVLIVAPSDRVQGVTLEALDFFLNKKNALGVYVTIAKPYKTVAGIMAKNGINTDNVFFIDCVSQMALGEEMERAGNCAFCQPQSLTNISLAMTAAIKSIPEGRERVLVLDTLSTLMLYNEATVVSRFMHALTARMREWNIHSVILTLEEETDKAVISQISQFCDKVIRVK